MSKDDGTTILGGRWLFIITETKGFRSTSKFPLPSDQETKQNYQEKQRTLLGKGTSGVSKQS
jgi:hypothetical protein